MTNRDVSELYRNAGFTPPQDIEPSARRLEKYGRSRKTVDGIEFDSSIEAAAYTILKLWERAGIIADLELQPVFVLQDKFIEASVENPRKTHRAIKYVADFRYRNVGSGAVVVGDAKGIKRSLAATQRAGLSVAELDGHRHRRDRLPEVHTHAAVRVQQMLAPGQSQFVMDGRHVSLISLSVAAADAMVHVMHRVLAAELVRAGELEASR